jgi:hypothetical protein
MPINYIYNKEKNILFVPVEGEVSLKDVDQFMRDIAESSEFSPKTRTIWDLRKSNLASLNTDFAKKLISIRKKYPERFEAKVAFVADKDLSFGLLRTYEALSTLELPQNIMVFRSLSKAEEWMLVEE